MASRSRDRLTAAHRALAVACVVLGASPSHLHAQQDQLAHLEGTVRDSSGALVRGARIAAVSAQLIGGTRHTETDETGQFRLLALAPGLYEVTASAGGFRTVQYTGLELSPGLGRTLTFQLEVAAISEEVVVRTTDVAIDLHGSAPSTIVGRELLEMLPFDPRRNNNGYSGFAPGINRGVAYGGTQKINSFTIDGTSGTDPTTGGVSTAPSTNWLEQVQVPSLGAGATQGEYTGARVNAITRSGGNRFTGLVEYVRTVPSWTGNNRGTMPQDLARMFRPLEIFERWTAATQAGGPVVRDRLWFFSGLDRYRTVQRPFSFLMRPLTASEPRTSSLDPRFLFKLTGAASHTVRLEGFASARQSTTVNSNAGPLVAPEALSTNRFPERMRNVQLTWIAGPRTLVEARYGRFWIDPVSGPTPPSTTAGPATRFDRVTGIRSGNVATFSDAWQQVSSTQASVTRHVGQSVAGGHQLRAGAELEWVRADVAAGAPGGVSYRDNNGVPDLAIFWNGEAYRPTQHRTSVFVQDRWTLASRVTLDPGVRINLYRGAVPGPGTVYRNRSVSPRVGIVLDASAYHRSVIRAHYGRYHEGFVTSLYDFLDPGSQNPTLTARVIGPGEFQEVARSAPTNISIAPDVKYAFVEETVAGLERDMGARTSVGVQGIHRRFRDAVGIIGSSANWTPVSVSDPGPDGRTGTVDDGAVMTVYNNPRPQDAQRLLGNPPDAWRRYTALQIFSTARRLGTWEVQAAYTWSSTRGSIDNDFGCCAVASLVGPNGRFVNPNRALFGTGRASLDRPHEVKLLGTYAWHRWRGVRVGGVYRYLSGAPWARTADFGPLTQAQGLIRVEPIGARSLPAFNTIDLRVEKLFQVSPSATLGLYADVFNVTNQGIPTAVNTLSGTNFGVPTSWLDPRTARVAVRLTF